MPELFQPVFAAGELTPSLWSRVDWSAYQTALAECRNAFPRSYGSVINRPGTRYCGGTFDNGRVRLVPFIFSNADTFVMEFGHEYIRFWRDAGPLLYTSGPDTGDPVEVVTPYQVEDLPYLRFVQSGDVVTIVHGFGGYAAAELKRISNENWTLTDITFGPAVRTPVVADITLAETNPTAGTVQYIYVFTYEDIGGQESLPTASKQVNNHNDGLSGTSYNTVTHTMPADIAYLNIYRFRGGSYGWVGRTSNGSFKDDGINPNLSDSPPMDRNPFEDDRHPHSVTYFEQRLVFGGFEGAPDTLEMSKTGAYHDFSKSNPMRDDDAISATLASSQVNRIEHLINFNTLLIFTAGATWRLDRGQNGLTPQLEGGLRLQNATGTSAMVAPLLAGGSVLHIEAGERRVRDLVYDLNSDQFQGQERSLTAAHFFEGATIVAWCWASAPHGLIWIVRSDGKVASLTYLREQQVFAWALHDFGGVVEDMVSIPEDGADTVYMVVRRQVGGVNVRYIERLAARDPVPIEDSWFLDCAVAYDGAPVTSVSGLDHLELQFVTLFLDGNPVQTQRQVVAGAVALPYEASKVLIGLPYTSRLTTLPLPPMRGLNRGQMKAVKSVLAEIRYTRGLWAGPPDDMMELKQREFEAWGEPTQPATGPVELTVSARWGLQGQVTIEQRDPLPFELLALAPQFDVGG